MTLHERVSRWPRRQRMYGFLATTAIAFALVVVAIRLAEPEMTAPLSFWLHVAEELVVVWGFAILITPPGQRWHREP